MRCYRDHVAIASAMGQVITTVRFVGHHHKGSGWLIG
jgi:hypothetical protein